MGEGLIMFLIALTLLFFLALKLRWVEDFLVKSVADEA